MIETAIDQIIETAIDKTIETTLLSDVCATRPSAAMLAMDALTLVSPRGPDGERLPLEPPSVTLAGRWATLWMAPLGTISPHGLLTALAELMVKHGYMRHAHSGEAHAAIHVAIADGDSWSDIAPGQHLLTDADGRAVLWRATTDLTVKPRPKRETREESRAKQREFLEHQRRIYHDLKRRLASRGRDVTRPTFEEFLANQYMKWASPLPFMGKDHLTEENIEDELERAREWAEDLLAADADSQ